MSTYVDTAINPKTGKSQLAIFIGDYYGSHQYGVGFKNDETDAVLFAEIVASDYSVYPIDKININVTSHQDDSQQTSEPPILANLHED
jgi:hypothetical protein